MARKSLGKAAKVLGGLGAAYALSQLPVGEGVRPEDVNPEDAAADALARKELSARTRVYKKGGVAKGWAAARGARAAKVY